MRMRLPEEDDVQRRGRLQKEARERGVEIPAPVEMPPEDIEVALVEFEDNTVSPDCEVKKVSKNHAYAARQRVKRRKKNGK